MWIFVLIKALDHKALLYQYDIDGLVHEIHNSCVLSMELRLSCTNPKISTHWGRVMHICVSKPTIIGSDNGLTPGRCQAIIWTNAGILLIRPLGTNFSEILIEIYIFSFKKMHFKISSAKWRPFCLGLNVLTTADSIIIHRMFCL